MKKYIDLVFKKNKKALEIKRIYEKVEMLIQEEDPSYSMSESDKREIRDVLDKGVKKLDYYRTPFGKYTSLSKTSFRKGKFHGNREGEGFVTSWFSYIDKNGRQVVSEHKYSISKNESNGAIDGDLVLIDVDRGGSTARVERILDRNIENITGTVVRVGNSCFLKPLDRKKQSITIALEESFYEGTIVSVNLVDQRSDNFYIGRVTRVFRHGDDPRKDTLLEAFKSGMPEGFSEESYQQLDTIPDKVLEKDKEGRVDFTSWNIFSIDGIGAKDKDDCIFYKKLPNGNILAGDFISDPPYYVPTDSPLHKDAFRKGTSYYIGNCVEAQYPKKLSTGICSLNEGEERLVKAIVMEYTPEGKVVRRELVRGVIQSKKSMNYDDVNRILVDGVIPPGYEEFASTLKDAFDFASILRKNRFACGAVEFNQPDPRFIYDENGKPIQPKLRIHGPAEMLIQEFMLAGNVNVGEILTENGIPCIYRIHAQPNHKRISQFLRLLMALGFAFPFSADEVCSSKEVLQALADFVSTTGELAPMLTSNLICCMSRAEYSSTNSGHYGTGFIIYLHFTSPMRRLADDTNSRIIDDCYFEEDPVKKKLAIQKWSILAPKYAYQATVMERLAQDVATNVYYLDTAVYMSQFIGQEFEGTVVSVGKNGLSIQLDNLREGRIRTKNLPGSYVYNPSTFSLLSLDGNVDYYIGDRLKLKLVSTSKATKTVDFISLGKIKENKIQDLNGTNQYVKSKAREENSRNLKELY